jgi:4-hydroxythreonine-4-phosphate dehydrogenase
MLERVKLIVEADAEIHVINHVSEAKNEFGIIDVIDLNLLPIDLPFGRVSKEAGNAAYQYIAKAVELAIEKKINAICTAPLNKEAMHKGGHLYPGHTEILAELTDTEDFSMMLTAPNLKVIHLTTHVGLIKAIEMINPERTYKVIKLAHDTLSRAGIENPSVAVCGTSTERVMGRDCSL